MLSITRPVLTLSLTSLTPTCKTAYCIFSDAGQSSTAFLTVALVLALCNWALWRPMKRSFATYLVVESPIKRASASLSLVVVGLVVRSRWSVDSTVAAMVVCAPTYGGISGVGWWTGATCGSALCAGCKVTLSTWWWSSGGRLSASFDGCPLERCCNNVPGGILSWTRAGVGLGAFGIAAAVPKPSFTACGDDEAGFLGLRLVTALINERSLAVGEHSTPSTLLSIFACVVTG